MQVQRRKFAFLQGKGLWQKVRFAKHQAKGVSAGAVFVVDSEGGAKQLDKTRAQLHKGRDACLSSFPMAVGVAQPCIESWLLADASAIQQGLELETTPDVPEQPEKLPAPCQEKKKKENPKKVLVRIAGVKKEELSAKEKDKIATAMNDMDLVRNRCPQSFAPFAEEVEERIGPLF